MGEYMEQNLSSNLDVVTHILQDIDYVKHGSVSVIYIYIYIYISNIFIMKHYDISCVNFEMWLDVYYFGIDFLDCCPHLYCVELKQRFGRSILRSSLGVLCLSGHRNFSIVKL